MWPRDLAVIYSKLKNLNTDHGFPDGARPFIFQEVIDHGSEAVSSKEYSVLASVTEFKHGSELSNAIEGNNPLKWLMNWGEEWSLLPSKHALVFVDNHDTQRYDGRILNYKKPKLYKVIIIIIYCKFFQIHYS